MSGVQVQGAAVEVVRRKAGPAFVLLGVVQVTLIFTLAAIAVPLPHIGREFGLVRAELVLLSAAYGLTFAGLLLFGGRLADRFGGRRVLTVGLVGFAAASVLVPLAPSYPALLGARFAQGAGAALVAPAAMAVLRSVFPEPAAYGRAMATWGGLSMLGATAGNLLAGVISAVTSWRLAFAVPLVVAVGALLLAPRLLPDAPPAEQKPGLDPAGAGLATGGVVLASYGLVLSDAYGWTAYEVLLPLLAGIGLLLGFLAVERRVVAPLLPPRFLLNRRRGLGLVAIALTAAGTSTTFVLFSLHLQEGRGWSPLETSAAFVPFAAALILSGRLAGPLIGRYGAGRVAGGGLLVGAAGLGLLALAGFTPSLPYVTGLLPGLLLLPAGAAASFAGAAVLATDGVPPGEAGLAGGVLNTAMELGATVVFALVLAVGGDGPSLAAAAAGFALLALLNYRSVHC